VERKNSIYILTGLILMSVSVMVFYKPNNIIAGGFSGIGIILNKSFGIKVSVTNFVLNLPLFMVSYKFLGRRYIVRSGICAILFSLFLEIALFLPQFKGDAILAVIYGGIIDGIGVGLVFKGVASTGGVDLFAALIHNIKPYIQISTALVFQVLFLYFLGICENKP